MLLCIELKLIFLIPRTPSHYSAISVNTKRLEPAWSSQDCLKCAPPPPAVSTFRRNPGQGVRGAVWLPGAQRWTLFCVLLEVLLVFKRQARGRGCKSLSVSSPLDFPAPPRPSDHCTSTSIPEPSRERCQVWPTPRAITCWLIIH